HRRGTDRPKNATGRNRRFYRSPRLPRRRLPIRKSHRPKRLPHCPLDSSGRMLVRADELGRRMETSTPLGTNHSRLPAFTLFFQHPQQSHPLAIAVGGSKAVPNFIRFPPPLPFPAHCRRTSSSTPPLTKPNHQSPITNY